jgi:hypothetical protein
MYRLDSVGDCIMLAIVSALVGALGVLMLLYPTERLPEAEAAYRRVEGVLRSFEDASPRRSVTVIFEVDGDPLRYVSHSRPTYDSVKGWQAGRTRVSFFVLAQDGAASAGSDGRAPRLNTVHGLVVDGRALNSLQDDIAHHNAGATAWLAALPLAIAVVGLLAAGLRGSQLQRGSTPA